MLTEIHILRRTLSIAGIIAALLVASGAQLEAEPLRDISRPEKVWSVFHPFKAFKVKECADRARIVTDSLGKAGTLTDRNGGQLDAFRHAYWMALMVNRGMKESVVRNIGTRHEKGNYIDFKKGKLEDSLRSDSMMCVMDLLNNDSGIKLGIEYMNGDKKLGLIELIIREIWNGKLVILRKDSNGLYLDRFNQVIDTSKYKDQWYIPKYIVNSDMIDIDH